MKQPRDEDYGPFYDDEKRETDEYLRYVRDITRYEEVRAHARNAIHFLIAAEKIGVGEDDFADELAIEHRTDQQRAARMLRLLLRAMAEAGYDDRNAGMVDFARLALQATGRIHLPYI